GNGELSDINADLRTAAGSIMLEGEEIGFDALEARLGYDPASGRLRLRHVAVDSAKARTTFAGQVVLETGEAGEVTGFFADLHAGETRLDLPDLLEAPVTLDAVDANFRARLDPLRIEVADLHTASGRLKVNARGKVATGAEGGPLTASMRAEASDMTVADLKALWPKGVGGNARAWALEHLVSGEIPALLAQLRLGAGDPDLALDFTFDDAVVDVLDGMPAIEGGRGEAQVRHNDMILALAAGSVTPLPGERIDLTGSYLDIFDFDGAVTPADIRLRASGGIDAVLALIDRPPLGLVSKLDLPLGSVGGSARVAADLEFPLLKDLLLEQIDVDVDATLSQVSAALPLPDLPVLPVESNRLRLVGSTRALSLTGPIRVAGRPFDLAWDEDFTATTTERQLSLEGGFDLGFLAELGAEQAVMTGGDAGARLSLTVTGGEPPLGSLELDLAQMALALPGLTWTKPAGVPARASVAVRLAETASIERLEVEGGGLDIAGAA
ncbi:MAG: hypothetical protein AAF698_09055, partial [Pseudomonadota bacterium]